MTGQFCRRECAPDFQILDAFLDKKHGKRNQVDAISELEGRRAIRSK